MLKKAAKFQGDKLLFFLPLVLSLFGLLMIFDASGVAALQDFKDQFYYLKMQSIWLSLGLILFIFFSWFDYQRLRKLALPGLILSLSFLIIVLLPGIGREALGGRRWLGIGNFVFQPAELTKLSLVIYLATLFEKRRELLTFFALISFIFLLLILEPDLGTAVIIVGTAFSLYFLAEAPMRHLVLMALFVLLIGPFLVLSSPYRKKRLLTFLNPLFEEQGASYHIRQALIAIGSGGFFGRGLGQSRQKFLFLPEVSTDSIFAVIAEELGLIGVTILLLAFIFLIYRGLKVASLAPDRFGQMLAGGIIFSLGFQTVINLSAMVSLVPLTGIPLPFISYGGSSLIVVLSGMGIVYNISKSKIRLAR